MLSILLTLASEKDRERVRALYNDHHEAMLRVAYYRLKGRSNARYEAEEAVQNAFVRIIRHIDSLDFGRKAEEIRSYVLTISCHEALRLAEKEVLLPEVEWEEEPADEEDFLEALCRQEDYSRVVNAIASLSDRYRTPLEMKYLWDKSAEDISTFLEIPLSSVYTLLRRGKALLVEMLQKGETP